jgi:hypothetical protein
MAYGFVVTQGTSNARLDDALHRAIAEVRIEQDMSRATKFAVRFEDDICEGQPTVLSADAIAPGEVLSVLVPDEDDGLVCLVQGQVTKLKSSAVTGGPGSWLEVHGEDGRAALGRETVTATWTGSASSIAQSVFALNGLASDVKSADAPTFGQGQGERSHNQSGPDLQLLENLARMLGYEFWFTYEASAIPGGSYTITPTANFKPSPDYGTAGLGSVPATPPLDLLPLSGDKVLRLDVARNCCRNITSFRVDVDVEKATMALVEGHDDQSGEPDSSESTDARPPVDPAADRTIAAFGCQRTISRPDAGSAAEQATQTDAALADEGWFVTASASTSAHLLPGVIQSHDIVAVEGHGFAHSGRYHVSKVVHVVNSWGHLMDVSLRRNALPSSARA